MSFLEKNPIPVEVILACRPGVHAEMAELLPEILFARTDDHSQNVIVDPHTVAALLAGEAIDSAHDKFWYIADVRPASADDF